MAMVLAVILLSKIDHEVLLSKFSRFLVTVYYPQDYSFAN
jgi:hypothetical protein